MRHSHLARTAVRAVFQNGLRTALTMLGLVIGISSVIVLVGIGDGSNQQVHDKMKELGGDAISAYLYQGELGYDDLAAVGALPAIDGAAPAKTLSSRLSRGKAVSNKAFIEASDENYLHVRNLKLLHGRNLLADRPGEQEQGDRAGLGGGQRAVRHHRRGGAEGQARRRRVRRRGRLAGPGPVDGPHHGATCPPWFPSPLP